MTKPDTRQRVLDALLLNISARGLEGASIREVASTAGVAIGTVQYYCRSKDEMLQMTFEHVADGILERARNIPKVGSVGSVVRTVLLASLPHDGPSLAAARVYLAFAARAAVSPALAEVQHAIMREMRSMCAEALRLAQERGQAPADVDPERWGVATLALVDGLMLHLLTDAEGVSHADAVAAVDAHMQAAFEGC